MPHDKGHSISRVRLERNPQRTENSPLIVNCTIHSPWKLDEQCNPLSPTVPKVKASDEY